MDAGMTRERAEGTAMTGRGREDTYLNGNFNKKSPVGSMS